MHLTLTSIMRTLRDVALASLAVSPIVFGCAASTAIAGESAFIEQATTQRNGVATFATAVPVVPVPIVPSGPHSTAVIPTAGLATPLRAGGNIAQTVQIGSFNQVFQMQSGTNNVSNVGIIGGVKNNVAVVQSGQNLRSNLAMVNTAGLSVGVLEPNGSAPLNMLIARLPNGGLLIKR